ncbi:hypothetical protein, unknown function [Leishmania tarentolae]|uniref:Uncharacterized protein n=1 Tax=Leishmania tarentolae TaxID=5689 RepID=A0A640KJT5_LEITA|nr:hypothetical protein, unknown function [Leishmania tarentolae]
MPTSANSLVLTEPFQRKPASATVLEEMSSASTHTTGNHMFKELCDSYVERYILQKYQVAHQRSLQARSSVNVQSTSFLKGQAPAAVSVSLSLTVPPELAREYARMKEESLTHCHGQNAPVEISARSTEELEAENAYLRSLVRCLERHLPYPSSLETPLGEAVSTPPSPRPSLGRESSTTSEPRLSPSAVRPDPLVKDVVGQYNSFTLRCGSEVSPPPATAQQVSELQEQIDLLCEAVRGLSQRASVAGGHSSSPVPADTAARSVQQNAVSPLPRCATPTCTTDVRTLQRIILNQQQTIRTLKQEMEDVHIAKVQMEQAMLQLREATASIAAREEGCAEDEDIGAFGATAHWRSTFQTEDRISGCISVVGEALHDYSGEDAADTVGHATTSGATGKDEAVQEMREIDLEAAVEQAPEKRRAATFGGMRPPLWLDSSASLADAVRLPGCVAGEDEDVDEPSSGMRTPLPRRTVLLHQRFSSATGDTSSVWGAAGIDESPFTQHTQMSCGTASNRRTSAAGSSAAL